MISDQIVLFVLYIVIALVGYSIGWLDGNEKAWKDINFIRAPFRHRGEK